VLQHPVYATWAPVWRELVQIYDGSGGFLDGTFLVAHPREWKDWSSDSPRVPTKKLKARRALARYENVAAVILDTKRAALFRESVTRTVGDGSGEKTHPIEEWWKNVDGEGCSIDDWVSDAFVWAGLFGHIFHYMDRVADGGAETAADAGALILRLYNPLDVPDWLQTDRGALTAVKLLEPTPRESINDAATMTDGAYMERIVTTDTWELRKMERQSKARAQVTTVEGPFPHEFGTLPIVVQYAKRKALAPLIGQPILGDPGLYIDLYNLTSEIRELLRSQTFGLMNVPLGTGADRVSVDEAQRMMGDEKGAENVIFTPGPGQYLQPDTANVTVYQEERSQLLRTIYRLVGLPWESDSQDAEAEGSMKLKREDFNQLLSMYANNCRAAEMGIAKLWFRGTYGDTWEREWDAANIQINYPQTFDVTPFAEALERAQASITLEYGPKFKAEQQKRLLPQFVPDAPPVLIEELEKECDAVSEENAEAAKAQKEAEVEATKAKASGGGGFGA
jgi:hypothetical protein